MLCCARQGMGVSINGAPVIGRVSAVEISGANVILTLADAVLSTDTVTVGYIDPTPGDSAVAIQDLDGTDAASFANSPVINNTGGGGGAYTDVTLDGLGSDAAAAALDALTGAYNYTDVVTVRGNASISGFSGDDKITITGATSAQYDTAISVATNGQDVQINYNSNGTLNLITLVGVAGGGFINDVASFNALTIGDIVFV